MLKEGFEPLLRRQRLRGRDQFLPQLLGKLRFHSIHNRDWSERRDLNSGPLAPHASALPDCATLRRFVLDACDRRERGSLALGVMIRRNAGFAGEPPRQAGRPRRSRGRYRLRTFSSSSSSSLTCLTICWLCDTSVRASSPVSLLRAPPIVKP